jgi:signal transduction histidine kinase
MKPFARLGELIGWLNRVLGPPGVMIGVISLLSFGFGVVVLAREYNRYRVSTTETLRELIGRWVKTASADYLGRQTLVDVVARWSRAEEAEREAALQAVRGALDDLGVEFERQARLYPWIDIVVMELAPVGGRPVATWRSRSGLLTETRVLERIPVVSVPGSPSIELSIRYRIAPEIERGLDGLEGSYRRILLAVLGLSGYSLLCFGYMIQHARNLRERVAHEAAQEASLDLADRTCHELGNVVFVLSNERRNLADHLDLVDRFSAEEAQALASATRRAGLDAIQAARLEQALRRAYAERGIDPSVELATSVAIAREVCRQIAVCSHYIALTVRELDAYLKQSSLSVRPEAVALSVCLDDALALLDPRLKAAGARVERPSSDPRLLADRRLLVHALVNLLKNSLEATTAVGIAPVLTVEATLEGSSVQIDLTDNGPGIPPDTFAHLFQPGHSTKGAGRGRGLFIVKNALRAQGGDVLVASTNPEGTTFRLVLPLAEPAAAESPN